MQRITINLDDDLLEVTCHGFWRSWPSSPLRRLASCGSTHWSLSLARSLSCVGPMGSPGSRARCCSIARLLQPPHLGRQQAVILLVPIK
jgi:hypothetical protein